MVDWRANREVVPMRSVVARSVYSVAVALNMVAIFANWYGRRALANEVNNYCNYLDTETQCNGWPLLSAQQCSDTLFCASSNTLGARHLDQPPCNQLNGSSSVPRPNFLCHWRKVENDYSYCECCILLL